MLKKKGYLKALNQRTFLFGSLLLILGLINPKGHEVKANIYSEYLIAKIFPVDIFNVNFSNFRTFDVKPDAPFHPTANKPSPNNNNSQSPSDQCYFKEGHRLIAEKGPETALLTFSGIFLGYPFNGKQFLYGLPLVIFSSRHGNTVKIRPPPEY